MERKEVMQLAVRYLLILALGIPSLFLFYSIFTPLTVYPVFFVLSLIDPSASFVPLIGNAISFKGITAALVPACIAGAAYYLLLALNLSTPMDARRRTFSLLFLFATFLVLNIIRIIIFANLYATGFAYADFSHTATWYFGSTVLLGGIWIANIRLFKIREVPLYSDIASVVKDLKRGQKGLKAIFPVT